MLFGRVAADKKYGRRRRSLAQAGGLAFVPCQRPRKGLIICRPLMVDVVGPEHRPRKLLQQIILFVGRLIRANDANRRAAARLAHLLQNPRGHAQRVLPGRLNQFAFGVAHQRLGQALLALYKIKAKPPLGAEKVAIDAAFVAIVGAHNLRTVIRLPHAQRHLAAIGAVRANRRNVVHLPGPRLVAIAADVSAPTGQMSIHIPHCSQSR